MRGIQLARVAAQAELLRLRGLSKRQATRAAFAAVAAIFLLATLVALHVAAGMALTLYVAPIWATLIVAAFDLIVGLILLVLAMRDTPSRMEEEAHQVRVLALEQMKEAAALTTLVGPMLRLLGTRKVYGLALATLTARYLGGRR